ncbi:MAG: acyl-CoA thioesterase [Lachnospiraceae bacterium]|nr:acyl-CoA thioesterase [Lachnospiraceae bacterium]
MKKKVSESLTEQVYIVRSQHINGYGRLFGGILMQWIDEIAGIVSRRHAGMTVTTAAIDNLRFEAPAYQDDMVVLVGKVTYVGKTSMEVRIDVYVEDNATGKRRTINRAYIVMVAISEDGTPVPVPGLEIETENERYEWMSGEKRYQLRKTRRKEGY